jgi:hypothetical protein
MKSEHLINWGILNAYLEPNAGDGLHEVRTMGPNASIPRRSPAFAVPTAYAGAISRTVTNATGLLSSAWQWIQAHQANRSNTKRLQVATTVSLGEKRFVAVIEIDGQQFLVGGGATNVALLAQLDSGGSFSTLLRDSLAAPLSPAPIDQPTNRTRKSIAKPSVKRMGTLA